MNVRVMAALVGMALLIPQAAQAQVLLRGVVRDAETERPLNAAHVVAEEVNRGTITNPEGRFELVVPSLPMVLSVRYIGYESRGVTIGLDDARDVEIRLEPAVYQLGEVLVAGEDFAENVMRKVIARKQAMRAAQRTAQGRGYSRFTLSHGEDIVLLSESVFDVYWKQGAGRRHVVRSRRHTADFYEQLGLDLIGEQADFYDDEIPIQGLRFIGPTHPEALAVYTFNLAQNRTLGGKTVYDIYIAPKASVEAAFVGTVSVLDEEYVLLETALRPARYVTFPDPVKAWPVFYYQQFAAADSFWLPLDLRLEGRIHIDPNDLGYPPAMLHQISQYDAYIINKPVPEAPFARSERVQIDSASVFDDNLFLMGRNIIPLTPREAVALDQLQGARMTLEQALPPRLGGALAAFAARRSELDGPQFAWPEIFGYEPWLRYNRVDGYFFGIGKLLPLSPRTSLEVRVAETSGLKRIRFFSRAAYRWGRGGTLSGGYARDTSPRQTGSLYTPALNGLTARFGAEDYFDYYWSEQAWLEAGYAFPLIRFTAEARWEEHASVERTLRQPWPWERTFQDNPAIVDGTFPTVTVSVATGDSFNPLRTGSSNRAELRVEHSLPGSEVRYTWLTGQVDAGLKTFFRRRPRPNRLHVRAFGGTSRGDVPPQRWHALDGSLGPVSTFGALHSLRGRPYEGDAYARVFWEHDFDTGPFEAFGLSALVDRRIGIRLFGGHGRTWLAAERRASASFDPNVAGTWHHEIGLGLTNLWGSPLRIDLTRRIDAPGWFFSVGLSRTR